MAENSENEKKSAKSKNGGISVVGLVINIDHFTHYTYCRNKFTVKYQKQLTKQEVQAHRILALNKILVSFKHELHFSITHCTHLQSVEGNVKIFT